MNMENNNIKERVEEALNEIRPFLLNDGGDIELISIEGKKVIVQLKGACIGCSVNQMTLKNGVESTIKKHVPEIEEVVDISQ